jgi:hypothetical protein
VESLALELRQQLAAHPGVVTLLVSAPMNGPHALALNERVLELLTDAGLKSADAARASYLLIVYVFGSITLEIAGVDKPGPLPPETERIAGRHRALSTALTDRYPLSAAASATVAGYISTEQYLWGLHHLLDGIITTSPRVPDSR